MKITGPSTPQVTPSPSSNAPRPKSEPAAVSQGSAPHSVAASQAAIASLATTRAARIDTIKKSLQSGTYKADPEQIADGIAATASLDAELTSGD